MGTNTSTSAVDARRIHEDVVAWVDKRQLATIYAVCRRTIDNWISQAFISYRKLPGGAVRFQVSKVEKDLSKFDLEGGLANVPAAVKSAFSSRPGSWVDKKHLAAIQGLSTRTIDSWMAKGCLPYRKFPGGSVRFHVEKVEKALEQFEFRRMSL